MIDSTTYLSTLDLNGLVFVVLGPVLENSVLDLNGGSELNSSGFSIRRNRQVNLLRFSQTVGTVPVTIVEVIGTRMFSRTTFKDRFGYSELSTDR